MNVAFPKLESGKELQSHSTFPHPPVKTVGDKGQVKVPYNYLKIQLQRSYVTLNVLLTF